MARAHRTSRNEAPSRRGEIVAWLASAETLTYSQIQKRFKVAPMTARRDVAALDAEGRAAKTLRGAMRVSPGGLLTEGPLHIRLKENLPAKKAIARVAMELIRSGDTLHLDGGTTCIELARLLARSRMRVTVVTNSVLVSACLCEGGEAKVLQLGGSLNTQNGCTTGAETEAAAKKYFLDMGIFTTHGFIPGEGTYESSEETFRVKLAFAPRCRRVVLLADHGKFGKRALTRVLADGQIHQIVTDQRIPHLDDKRLLVAPARAR